MIRTRTALAASFGLALASSGSHAQSAADFYKGKTVNMIISSSAGGGYDTLSRTIARHLPQVFALMLKILAGAHKSR
jgi:tripartite-type tricarboxylate transporter receptor subunit TctC